MSFSTACELDSAQKPHRKLKSSLRDPLLSTKPIDTRPTGLVFQQNFGNYLDGQLNANKLIQKLNYPRQNYQKPLVTSKFDPFAKIKLKTEQRKKYLQSKISKVQALIQQKVVLKKTENTQIRQENSQNLVFVQCIIDIAKQSINDSRSPTRMTPKSKCLNGCRLNYDNVKPTCQFLKEKQYTDIQRPYLKTALESNTQLYMEELEAQNLQRENYLNRQVKLSIQQRKSDFKLFHTAAKTDRKNQDGILTYADVQLYDYLYNKPKSITITNHPKYIQNVIDSDTQLRRQTQPSPTPKRYVHYNQEFPDADSVSYTSSLQSAGEIKLDKYYSESMQLKKTEQSQLCKRIKQLMRLEDLNQQLINYKQKSNPYNTEQNIVNIYIKLNTLIMQRTWLESAKRPLDVNFDIKSFRTQVKDKIKPCNSMTSDMGYSKYSSAKKETLQSAPSFENLQARIRDFSYSRLGNVASQRTQQNTYSPYKIQGLQQKITDSIGPRNLAVKTFQSTSPLKNYKSFQMNQDRFDIPSAKQKAKRNLVDVVQLNEVVSLRNKIESSYVQRSSLTSTYVSELIRLAQVITSSLKQD